MPDLLITSEDLHAAAAVIDNERPEGTPESYGQAEEIARWIAESNWTMREESGELAERFAPDPASLGYGVLIGIIAATRGRRMDVLPGLEDRK